MDTKCKAPLETELIDRHLETVLRASGSSLRNYSIQKNIDAMRAAMTEAMQVRGAAHDDLVKALRIAETALAFAESYKAITQGRDGIRITNALQCVRSEIAKTGAA